MSRNKTILVMVIIAFCVGGLLGRFAGPVKVVTVETVKEEKQQTVDSAKDIKDTSETTILEVTRPDGTVTKTTKTKKNVITSATKDVRTDSSRDAEKTTVKEFEAGWAVRLLVATRLNQSTLEYGVGVDHKILGPITVGAWGLTDGTLGASIGLRF